MNLRLIVNPLVLLCGCLPLAGATDGIRAEVQPVSSVFTDLGDPEVVAFNVKFDMVLSNDSTRSIDVPRSGSSDGVTRIAVLAVQLKASDGSWSTIMQNSFYDSGTVKYDSCVSLGGSASVHFNGLEALLTQLKKQAVDLKNYPTLRFKMMTLCRQRAEASRGSLHGGGAVLSTEFMTAPFAVQFPR